MQYNLLHSNVLHSKGQECAEEQIPRQTILASNVHLKECLALATGHQNYLLVDAGTMAAPV